MNLEAVRVRIVAAHNSIYTSYRNLKMPDSSLWLLPPADHPLNAVLASLIRQTSSHFDSTHLFLPHVTLTSEISPSSHSSDPQAWLDALDLPSGNDVRVKFEKLASEDVFVRKLYIQCAKTNGLEKLAGASRREVDDFGDDAKVSEWVNDKYNPHVSLLYHDCLQIDVSGLSEVEAFLEQAGVALAGKGSLCGWRGGRVVLVQTDKSVEHWIPIAERHL